MTPPSDPSHRHRRSRDDRADAVGRGLFTGRFVDSVVGKANAAQRRAHALYREAVEAGIAAVRPGATAADVARAENDVFRQHGLGDYVTDRYTRVRGHGLVAP